jgi:dynactin 1
MRNVTKQSERIEQLEKQVTEGTAREKDFADAIESLNDEISALESEVSKWKKMANDKRAVGEVDKLGAERAVASAMEVGDLKREIKGLTGAVNFFREENSRVKKVELSAADSWLLEPLGSGADVKEFDDYETALAREGRDVFAQLMVLATESRVVDLSKTPENRKSWRPVRSTPRYQLLEQRERYETLAAWRDEVITRASYHNAVKASFTPRKSKKARNIFGAKVDLFLDGAAPGGKHAAPAEVVIQEPDGWESFQESMGLS